MRNIDNLYGGFIQGIYDYFTHRIFVFYFYTEYKHIGCFADKAARAIPKHMWTFIFESPGEKIRKCSEMAEKDGFRVFGVQYGGQCFSGPSADKTYNKYGESSHCSNGVGGSWANDVYAFPGTIITKRSLNKIKDNDKCFFNAFLILRV